MAPTPAEQIIADIQRFPKTFLNITLSGEGLAIFGPTPLGKQEDTPPYGFTEQLIQAAAHGDTQQVIFERYKELSGSHFGMFAERLEGSASVSMLMRFARADIILCTEYSDSWSLNAWSARKEHVEDLRKIARECGLMPYRVAREIGSLLTPDSGLPAGRTLCEKINENYR